MTRRRRLTPGTCALLLTLVFALIALAFFMTACAASGVCVRRCVWTAARESYGYEKACGCETRD